MGHCFRTERLLALPIGTSGLRQPLQQFESYGVSVI